MADETPTTSPPPVSVAPPRPSPLVAELSEAPDADLLRLPTRPWVAIIANPFSGRRSNRKRVQQLSQSLGQHDILSLTTWSPEQRRGLLSHPNLARYCACIVIAGGDGTVAAVCNDTPPGPARDIPLAVLPLGNENLVAKHFRFNRGPDAIATAINRGWHQRIDVGWITPGFPEIPAPLNPPAPADPRTIPGARCFTLMLSAGLDAQVVHNVAQWRTRGKKLRRVNHLSYIRPILSAIKNYDYPTLQLHANGQTYSGCHAFIFNLPRYALNLPFAPEALPADGQLDFVVFQKPGFFNAARYLLDVRLRRHFYRPDVFHGRAARITLTSTAPVPLQSDGDPAGFTPCDLTVQANALPFVLL